MACMIMLHSIVLVYTCVLKDSMDTGLLKYVWKYVQMEHMLKIILIPAWNAVLRDHMPTISCMYV